MGGVRALLVVELLRPLDQDAGFGPAAEPLPVQQLIPQLPVETLDEAFLPRAAGRDESWADRRSQRMTFAQVSSTLLSERT